MGKRSARFKAKVVPSGNAAGLEVPAAAVEALGAGARPPVAITIKGHTWRSRIAVMRGQRLIGISAANRTASGIVLGETVTVTLTLDTELRAVVLPPDLARALAAKPGAKAAFEDLPFGLRRRHVAQIEDAKTLETRRRRIAKLVEGLSA